MQEFIIISDHFYQFRFKDQTQSMPAWNFKTQYRPVWLILRFVTNYMIYYNLLSDPGFTDELCGPLAIPITSNFFTHIFLIQLIYLIWPSCINLYSILNSNNNSSIIRFYGMGIFKIVLILIIKCFIIFGSDQRLKYYLHVAIIQLVIVIVTFFFDIAGNTKMIQATEIILIDSLQKIAIFYEVTRTFCPNFAIYCFFTNLLILCVSQIEAHLFYNYTNYQRNDPVYPAALYVKQDVYRIMILTFVYFGLFSIFQVSTYGYAMLVVFIISSFPLISSINSLQAGDYSKSLIYLGLVFLPIWALLWLRVNKSEIFKDFSSDRFQICGIFDHR